AGPRTKKRCAVLASFALYGVRSSEWLDEDPQRVVTELRQQQQQTRSGRRTRSDQRKTDRQQQGEGEQQTGRQQQSSRQQQAGRQQQSHRHQHSQQEPSRAAALKVLGLEMGASQQAIKKAHRNLVKQHHPDMGGSAEAFRRVNEAYQLLIG
ncbi:MAG: J domain-containing protein, partial [Prochlorococcus sp.]|nr:J domain-containing protein [Prochlorococcus sp.]